MNQHWTKGVRAASGILRTWFRSKGRCRSLGCRERVIERNLRRFSLVLLLSDARECAIPCRVAVLWYQGAMSELQS